MMEYLSINIAKIRRGDLFWESDGGQDALFIATSDAHRDEKHRGVAIEGREIPSGKAQRFFENDRAGGYGPRLYNQPQYTRPDWAALLVGLAAIMREELTEHDGQAAAREAGLKVAGLQCIEDRDQWMIRARGMEQEIALLRSLLDDIDDLASQNLNGITMGKRIKHQIASALTPAARDRRQP